MVRLASRADTSDMTKLVKGSITLTVDAWLKAQHPHSAVTPERYVELYLAELQRDGWKVVSAG
jgi:hypothetical protein